MQDGQRESDRAGSLVVVERLGSIELLAYVVGDFLVETSLGFREPVRHRMGDALRKQRSTVELEQVLLDHTAHQVGDLGLVDTVAESALETVGVE